MQKTWVWKQTSKVITQVPFSEAQVEVSGHTGWPPEKVEKELIQEKRLVKLPEAKYHIWRDSLY